MTTATWTRLGVLALALLAAASTVPAATATHPEDSGNHGTVKIHDEADADPDVRNEPHVDCEDFWVEGFNMAAASGTLTFYAWPPTGDKSVALTANWTADSAEMDHFMEGPFTLAPGHYKLEATNIDGHVKMKVFWVDQCGPVCPPEGDVSAATQQEECHNVPECPSDVIATANSDGTVTLTFTNAAAADGYNVYRAEGDGEFEYMATVGANTTAIVDISTEAGVTYTYRLATTLDGNEAADCKDVTVTAIPEFPTVIGLSLAAGLGTLAYAMLRRKN